MQTKEKGIVFEPATSDKAERHYTALHQMLADELKLTRLKLEGEDKE
jgi:hypothetical protein